MSKVHRFWNKWFLIEQTGHSTEIALLSIKMIYIYRSLGEATALVLLDLLSLDTIDHPTLLCVLKQWFGVSGSQMTWFSFYLHGRYQYIKIGSTLSDAYQLLFGVPQGSVLGPLLFSLYTTLLSYVIGKHKGIRFHFYAGDTQLYIHFTHKNATPALDRLNSCCMISKIGWILISLN